MKGAFAISAVPAAALAGVIGAFAPTHMPQVAGGDDALSVAFGDAKGAISTAMVQKADRYFHGGVEIDYCSLDGDHDHEHEHCDHGHGHCEHEHGHDMAEVRFADDPWAWINSRIRAPQVERHLEGERAVELMPWFWASVKADPHNVDAWTTCIYIAGHVMKDEALTGRVIAAAKEKNPGSAAILVEEGRYLYKMGKGDALAAEIAFDRARSLLLEKCDGRPDGLDEPDRMTLRAADDYLAAIRKTGRL